MTTNLYTLPPGDRAVLAITRLYMQDESAGLDKITDAMITDTARVWAIDTSEEHDIAIFLADFVLQMRLEDEEDSDKGDDWS